MGVAPFCIFDVPQEVGAQVKECTPCPAPRPLSRGEGVVASGENGLCIWNTGCVMLHHQLSARGVREAGEVGISTATES